MTRACCCSGRSGLFMTGLISLVGCMCVLLPCVYCMVREEGWNMLRDWINSWLVRNHWDVEVTQSVWRGLDWIDEYYRNQLKKIFNGYSKFKHGQQDCDKNTKKNKKTLFLMKNIIHYS